VKVGSGEVLKASKVGNIRGVICSKHGKTLTPAKLSTVIHTPQSKYNLISLTQFLNQGWLLKEDSNQLMLTKNGLQLILIYE